MFDKQISTHQWLALPIEIRLRLVKDFTLNRSGVTIVENNEVKSDGFTYKDISAINIESLQQYLGSEETDLIKLLEKMVQKIQDEASPKISASPFPTITNEEKDLFRKEYDERMAARKLEESNNLNNLNKTDEQKINEETKQEAGATDKQNKGATTSRSGAKKGSRKNANNSSGSVVPVVKE